jgi:hypothetical protein
MKEAHLLVVDVSGGQRGEYEWFVKDAETGEVIKNGNMTCDGMSEVEALEEASVVGYQVVYMQVIDGPKDQIAGICTYCNKPLDLVLRSEEYDLIFGETKYFQKRLT